MKKCKTKLIAALLATLMIFSFAGCTQSGGEESSGAKAESSAAGESSAEAADTAEEAEPAIKATTVSFSKSGKYTTTVTSDKVDLSGITAEDVEISYVDISGVTIEEVQQSAATSDEEVIAATVKVKVDSVKANTNGGYDISFTDENAPLNPTNYYDISFTKLEETASAEVVYPEITLTPDVENVVSDATQAKVTLAIDGSTFEDGISEKDIYLDNAFSDMEIESVSSSDKNLTVQLKGSPVRNVAGAYQWGSVNVKPSGITDGYADVSSKIDIKLATVNIDASTLKFENGKINADLKVYGVVDINTLTKDNIRIDGAAVEAAEKTDDNTIKLTLAADGVSSVNDFADTVGGKKMTLDDYETTVAVSQASFYPVFDYVEENGDNLKLTLKLYANSGTFDKNIKKDAISFADDFKEAKAESVTVDSDTLATLLLSVPANGQTTETFKMNGTVTLAAGSLTNVWGDATSAEASYTRDYSGETLGRGVTLNTDTLLEIQKYTRGKNTTFGCILYWGGVAGQVYSIGKSILEAAGVLESDQAQLLRELSEINKKLDNVSAQIDAARIEIVNTIVERDIQNNLNDYNNKMDTLKTKLRNVSLFYDKARKDLAAADERYADIDWENMTNKEASEYNHALIQFILSKADTRTNVGYVEFLEESKDLKDVFEDITTDIARIDASNPICVLDEACSLKYNFDTQAYEIRLAQRVYAKTMLTKAFAALAIRWDAGENPNNATGICEDFQSALDALEELDNIGHPVSEIKTVSSEKIIKAEGKFISDVMLIGSNNNTSKIQRQISGKGYTMVNQNLNEGNGGMKIFLGYKTTTDADNAITGFLLTDAYKGDSYNGAAIVPCMGYSDFTEKHGDLNTNGTNKTKSLYLYYYKDQNAKKVITDFYFDSKSENTISLTSGVNGDFKQGTFVYDSQKTFMHCKDTDRNIYVREGEDPEYYPYSYVIGKKVRIYNSSEYNFLDRIKVYNALAQPTKGRYYGSDWTDNQVKEFMRRLNGRTLSAELEAVGLKAKHPIATKVRGANVMGVGVVLGDYIDPSGKSLHKDVKFYEVIIVNGKIYKNRENKLQEFSLFEVY